MSNESADKSEKRGVHIGKYEVVRHLATGGMGAVYEAYDGECDRPVALKVLAPEMAARRRMLARFRREARSAAKLCHENIVAVYEFGEFGGTHFLAMEFVDGLDLHHYVLKKRRLNPEEARQILIQAARALDHAHQQQIVHRDIKPSNFLITEQDGGLVVKLTDFGLAVQGTEEDFRLTKAGTTVGTVDYMSPEQARKSQSADIRSDIYSLGCTFFHMLTGQPPFPEGSMAERILQHQQADPPDVREHHPDISEGLVIILKKMLAKKPQDRYQTPAELLADLENPERLHDAATKSDQLKLLAALAAAEGPTRKRKTIAPPIFVKDALDEDEQEKEDSVPFPWEKHAALASKTSATKHVQISPPKRLPAWWPIAACCIGLGILSGFVWLWLRSDGSPPDQPSKEPDPIVKAKEPEKKSEPLVKKEPEKKEFVGPLEPEFKRIALLSDADRLAWSREAHGPFENFPNDPPNAVIVRVSRVPGAAQFTSVSEALARTEGHVIVEIDDNGPLFETSLPPINGRSITLRGGPGYRPLLAWESARASDISAPSESSQEAQAAKGKDASNTAMFRLTGGGLVLEDLDLVTKWNGSADEEPPSFFRLEQCDLQARRCTFSAAGKHARGIRLAYFPDPQVAVFTKPPRMRLTQCIARGTDLMPLVAEGRGLEILIERSLLVSSNHPLFTFACEDSEVVDLRVIRSTLASGAEICRWQSPPGSGAAPRLKAWIWDSVLTRAAPTSAGEMIFLPNGTGRAMSWRAMNSAYAGWSRLFRAADRSFSAAALEDFRKYFGYPSRDFSSLTPWPPQTIVAPEVQSLESLSLQGSPLQFAATTDGAAIGCIFGQLPTVPVAWLQRAYLWYSHQVPPFGDAARAPPIPSGGGLYHGERIILSKDDPAQVLRKRLKTARPGPRVVLHLAGTGKHAIEPIQVNGIDRLVLYFEPAKTADESLTLLPRSASTAEGGPLIDVLGGSLEILGGSFALPDSASFSCLVRASGPELLLHRCRIQGPFGHQERQSEPDDDRCLIRFEPASAAKDAALLACKDCVLISAGPAVDIRGTRAQARLKNCLVVSKDNALILSPGATSQPDLSLWLENSTFAFEKSLLDVRWTPEETQGWRPILVQTQENYFLDPFSTVHRNSALLRLPAQALASGRFVWRGKNNAFDAGLPVYLAIGEAAADSKQALSIWRRLWGKIGEQNPQLIAAPKDSSALTLPMQSPERLMVPPDAGLSVGADLARLGLLGKK